MVADSAFYFHGGDRIPSLPPRVESSDSLYQVNTDTHYLCALSLRVCPNRALVPRFLHDQARGLDDKVRKGFYGEPHIACIRLVVSDSLARPMLSVPDPPPQLWWRLSVCSRVRVRLTQPVPSYTFPIFESPRPR